MAKASQKYLDTEAMKLGYQQMLEDVNLELKTASKLTDGMKAILTEKMMSIHVRLEELK
jgi:hypothetical protein